MSLQTTILIVDYNRVALNCILQQYNCEMDAMKSKDGSDARSAAQRVNDMAMCMAGQFWSALAQVKYTSTI